MMTFFAVVYMKCICDFIQPHGCNINKIRLIIMTACEYLKYYKREFASCLIEFKVKNSKIMRTAIYQKQHYLFLLAVSKSSCPSTVSGVNKKVGICVDDVKFCIIKAARHGQGYGQWQLQHFCSTFGIDLRSRNSARKKRLTISYEGECTTCKACHIADKQASKSHQQSRQSHDTQKSERCKAFVKQQ